MLRGRPAAWFAAAVLVAAAPCGCGSDGTATAACPQDLPQTCPSPSPRFAADVQPIFERRCWRCHTGSGEAAASHDFSSYDRIFGQRSAILNQVYACRMPPSEATPLAAEERAALLGWLVCKAPND
jgi:hypothetical protein